RGDLDAGVLQHLGAVQVLGNDADGADAAGLADYHFAAGRGEQVTAAVSGEVDQPGDGLLLRHGANISSQLESADSSPTGAVDIEHDTLDHRVGNRCAQLTPQLFIAGHDLAHLQVGRTADQDATDGDHLDPSAANGLAAAFLGPLHARGVVIIVVPEL